MEKVEKVIWGIIGAGDVCEIKSAPAMSQIEHSEVKMIMRRNAEKLPTMQIVMALNFGLPTYQNF